MGKIPNDNLEEILAANDIVEVISSYFPLKRAGSTFKALCPFHQEKSPSFTVNPQRQIFKCFGCGAGGSAFKFVELYEHLNFPEAVKKLAARAGIAVIEEGGYGGGEDDEQHETRRVLLQLHTEAAEWFHENLLKREWARAARDYLRKRGIDRNIAGNWQIGFAPESWDSLLQWALGRGFRRTEIVQSGLVKLREEERPEGEVYDRFRGRIMFPICNDSGEVIAFSGRVLTSESAAAKYLNSPETPLFRKGNVLFGLHKTKRPLIDAKAAIVCEGQLDLITLFEAGITNVVAPQGTAFTEYQARILKRYVDEVVLCFDADAAGQKAAERSLESLMQNDLVVRIAEMPAGDDPDSIVRRDGREEFEKRIAEARNFFDYWIEREATAADLNSLGAKMQLARKLAETVARIHDPIMRSEVVSKVTARIGIAQHDFEVLLKKPSPDRNHAREEEQSRGQPLPAPRHDVALLCLLALRDAEARDYLLGEDWRAVLAQTPDAEMLALILQAELRPDDAASVNVFTSKLRAEEEALVASWLSQRMPPRAAAVARDWWSGLKQAAVRRQLQIAEGRMKMPQLNAGEMTALQKQVVDLKAQLAELCAFSSARVLDP